MSLGLHERRAKRRRKFWWGVIKWLIALAIIGALGVKAYYTGSDIAQRDLIAEQEKTARLTGELASLNQSVEDLQAQLDSAKRSASDWQKKYETDVPTGALKDVLDLASGKLDSGVEMDRLRFLIDSAQNERSCDKAPVTKRFFVGTDLYSGANDSVTFAKSAITITAKGESAKDAAGNVEAWYDAAQPLNVNFTLLGGKNIEESGKLPLHRSVVINNSEYRFSLTEGPRGFVIISGDRCDYP